MRKGLVLWLVPLVALSLAWAQQDSTTTQRGWLGVYTEDLSRPMLIAFDIDHGVLVAGVVDSSPAQLAGMGTGDVIIEVDGERVEDGHTLRLIVRQRPEKKVSVAIRRRGQKKQLSVALGVREKLAWVGNLDFPDFPDVMKLTGKTLRKAGLEFEEGTRAMSLDSLRKEVNELRKEIESLKAKLQKQGKGM